MILATITGNLTSDPEKKSWPAKGDRKAEEYTSVRVAANPRFGKGAIFVEVKFRRKFEADIALNMRKGDPIVVFGELTEKEDKKGKLWKEIYDASFAQLPPKREGSKPAASSGDADDLDEDAIEADDLDDEDLPV